MKYVVLTGPRACGAVPSRLFDTQLAAGFLGHATPSLGNLLSSELGVNLPKADRLVEGRRELDGGKPGCPGRAGPTHAAGSVRPRVQSLPSQWKLANRT